MKQNFGTRTKETRGYLFLFLFLFYLLALRTGPLNECETRFSRWETIFLLAAISYLGKRSIPARSTARRSTVKQLLFLFIEVVMIKMNKKWKYFHESFTKLLYFGISFYFTVFLVTLVSFYYTLLF